MKKQATIKQAARLASKAISQLKSDGKFLAACNALGIPPEPPGQFWRVNREGILWFREFVKNGGLVLDPAYWQLENNAVGAVSAAIEHALVTGSDPTKAASRFIYEGPANEVIQTQVDPDDYDRVSDLFVQLINRAHSS